MKCNRDINAEKYCFYYPQEFSNIQQNMKPRRGPPKNSEIHKPEVINISLSQIQKIK